MVDPGPAAFGTFAPTTVQRALQRLFNGTPLGYSKLRRPALNRFRSERDGPVDTTLFGLKVRFYPNDNQTDAKSSLCGTCLNAAEQRWLRRALSPGATFVDVGANTGFFTLFAATLGARLIAIEPHPVTFGRLAENLRLNGLEAALFNCAAGASAQDVALAPGANDLGSSAIAETGIPVVMRPLVDMVGETGATRIDALKIDVEGYEDKVLLPFFETAPRTLWPSCIVTEHSSRKEWRADLISALTDRFGYRRKASNRANMLLVR